MTTATDDYHLGHLYRALSDKQWQKVRASLKAVGVDADTIVAVELWISTPETRELFSRSLRETIPSIAWNCCAGAHLPKTTPKQLIAELTRIIKSCNHLSFRCNALLDRLDPEAGTDVLWGPIFTMRDTLRAWGAELERWRDERPAMNASGNNVRTAHNLFWQRLAGIFDAHVSNDVKSRNQHEIRFLRACSEPFFPEVITDGAISAFVERRSTRSTSST